MNRYESKIESWDWPGLKQDAENNPQTDPYGNRVGCVFLGTVMALLPSGRYSHPLSDHRSEAEAEADMAWLSALDRVAGRHGMGIESGEGDPCNLFACLPLDDKGAEAAEE